MLSRGGVPKIFDARKKCQPYNALMLSYAPDLYVSRYMYLGILYQIMRTVPS